jgi:hypothetical protein
MTEREANAIVAPFHFKARYAGLGFFLNQGGDDMMYVANTGEVTPYIDDANAFYVASRLAAVLRKRRLELEKQIDKLPKTMRAL